MQRVALARALVNRPRVLLLDEPLSALDLKIRLEMEVELRRVHRETGATFVYVTHDQREALALSDRVVVFDEGRIEQVGLARRDLPLARRRRSPPASSATRTCFRSRSSTASGPDARVLLAGHEIDVRAGESVAAGPAWLVVRPEVVRLDVPSADGGAALRGTVHDLAFRGSGYTYRIAVDGLDEPVKAEVAAGGGASFELGSEVDLHWDPGSCGLLPRTD